MTKVEAVINCPKCGQGLKVFDCIYCHWCGHQLKASKKTPFSSPAYIYFQIKDVIEEGNFKEEERSEELNKLKAERNTWFESCTDEDRIAAMDDAVGVIRNVLRSKNVSISTLKNITATGKRIGALAKAYEAVAELGGRFHGSTEFFEGAGSGPGKQSSSAIGRAGDISAE